MPFNRYLKPRTDSVPPPVPAAPPQDETWKQYLPGTDMGGGYPTQQPTKDERYLYFLLHPSVPDSSQNNGLKRMWLFNTEAVKHLQLTMFPDQGSYHRFKEALSDLMRIGNWDAEDYLQQRQLKLYADVMARKSIGWTKNPRERDAINENRFTNVVRDDRTPPPRESPSFLGGMFWR